MPQQSCESPVMSSNDTTTKHDESTVEIGDFDIQCDIQVAMTFSDWSTPAFPCTLPARWVGRYPCCGKSALVCEPHQADVNPYLCMTCKVRWPNLVHWNRL